MNGSTFLPGRRDTDSPAGPWWKEATFYQVYPRSFADSDGDGIGDIPGIISRISHLKDLGVDALWLSPFFPSPQADAGYDVSDYRDVEPRFGTLEDFDALVAAGVTQGLRLIIDLVPNHCSTEHPDFRAALRSAPGSPERARFHFLPGRGADGELPPNNWQSVFHGPAWTRVVESDGRPGEWYLHLFDSSQPDWNWESPQVRADFRDTLRFWLDRGVDGFRVDVAKGLVKAPGLPDATDDRVNEDNYIGPDGAPAPMWDQDAVHEIYEDWRAVLDEYPGERVLVAEAWVPLYRQANYVRAGRMSQAFNGIYLAAPWHAAELRKVITESFQEMAAVEAPCTWALNNHDTVRTTSRYGYGGSAAAPAGGIGPRSAQPDTERGLRRARAAACLMLALPGAAYLYQGEELGLPEATRLPDDVRQDPTWRRTSGAVYGRDGCRVPLPWEAGSPAYGFSPNGASWLPQPPEFAAVAADVQHRTDGSTLELYRAALALRRAHGLGTASLSWNGDQSEHVLTFVVGDVLVISNTGDAPVALPDGGQILLTSGEGAHSGDVPSDTTVWLRMPAGLDRA